MNISEQYPDSGLPASPDFLVTKQQHGQRPVRRYRPDIDGLRAIAIVLVVLSHIGFKKTQGGFVGVDIFFVISGYLLTGNIARDLAAGTFSLGRFYERRIRRIAPALVAMLAATSVAAYFVFPSIALILFAQSLLAAIFSYSNFYFYGQPNDYFSPTYTKLLLHTWSLGVEEQFYLFLPFCMLLAAKRKGNATRVVIGALGLASLAGAAYLTRSERTLAFYMPYTRAWEFLIGSALALRMVPSPTSRAVREAIAILSLLLIVGCLFTYTDATPFPGLTAIPPCIAAAMLILIGEREKTSASSFLSWDPVTFIGAISYSLYLWHWPVILFFRLGLIPSLDYRGFHGLAVLSIVVSIALATLSWKFVEQPFRTGRWKAMPRMMVFRIAGASALSISLVAVTFMLAKGLPARFPGSANTVGNYLFIDSTRRPGCFVERSFAAFDASLCLKRRPGNRNFLLFGDSHADALWFGLARMMPETNVLQATGSSCPPVRSHYDRSTCADLRRFVYDDYLLTHRVDMVILTEAWRSQADLVALEPSLRWFNDHRIPVTVVGPVPEYTAPLPLLLAFSQRWGARTLAEHRLSKNLGELDRELREKLQGRKGIRYASVWRALCPRDRCQEYVDLAESIPMLVDTNHLTGEGATLAVSRMQAVGEIPR